MEKEWIIWTSSVLLALGLIFTGCGEKKSVETSAPPATEQAQTTAESSQAEQRTVAPVPSGEETQPKEGGDLIKEGASGDVIRP